MIVLVGYVRYLVGNFEKIIEWNIRISFETRIPDSATLFHIAKLNCQTCAVGFQIEITQNPSDGAYRSGSNAKVTASIGTFQVGVQDISFRQS